MLVINNAADSRKLSEANDPTRNNIQLNDYCKHIENAIDKATAKGQYLTLAKIPTTFCAYITKQLVHQGYNVLQNKLQEPPADYGYSELQISW